MLHDSCLNDGVLSVSRKRCQISVSQMTDGKDDLVSRRNVSIEEAALDGGIGVHGHFKFMRKSVTKKYPVDFSPLAFHWVQAVHSDVNNRTTCE